MSTREGLARALEAVVGSAYLVPAEAGEPYAIDGVPPALVVLPADEAEIIAVLRLAAEQQATVFPRGGGSHTHLGQTPARVDIVLSLERLQHQLAYEPADMTTTVQAGIRVATLQQTLQTHGQFLALDPPLTTTTTLGGVLMTNASGPRRLLYGTARDLVLGTTVITVDGTRAKAGGRVVKNVTGYDVTKLYIGSLGTLAILVELTCKLHPLPPGEVTLTLGCANTADLALLLPTLLRVPLRLNSLDLINAAAGTLLAARAGQALPATAYTLLARLEGTPEVTQSQTQRLRAAVQALALTQPVQIDTWPTVEQAHGWHVLDALMHGVSDDPMPPPSLVAKISLRMSAVPGLCQDMEALAASTAMPWLLRAHAGSGIVSVALPETSADVERLLAHLQTLAACVARHQGHFVLERAPVAVKQHWPVWGPRRDDFPLMQALKLSYDPQRRLNPGRFLGGL